MTNTATLSLSVLHKVAALGAFAATGREASNTPVLSGVAVSVANGELRAAATDRHAIARVILAVEDWGEFPQSIIPSALLARALKDATRDRAHEVTLTRDIDTVRLEWAAGSVTGRAISGNFPPVDRLYGDVHTALAASELPPIPAGTLLRPTLLAKLAKLTNPAGKNPRAREVVFAFNSASERERAPIRATDPATGYDVLIQPNRPPRP